MSEETLARLEEERDRLAGICHQEAERRVAAEAEVERLRKATERFILAAEHEDELLSNSPDIWNAYEAARECLGHPVQSYPGGYYDTHFHLYEWEEGDHCDTCDDYAADQKAAAELERLRGGGWG
jgi:hypothetical protein